MEAGKVNTVITPSGTEATSKSIRLQLGIGIFHILHTYPERMFDLEKLFWIVQSECRPSPLPSGVSHLRPQRLEVPCTPSSASLRRAGRPPAFPLWDSRVQLCLRFPAPSPALHKAAASAHGPLPATASSRGSRRRPGLNAPASADPARRGQLATGRAPPAAPRSSCLTRRLDLRLLFLSM